MSSAFERLGGQSVLRAIIDDFVGRICDDMMIGFFFRHTDRERLKELEYQHAAQHLGAAVVYEGRDLRLAHQVHRIKSGQFARRMQLLRDVLSQHAVPEDIRVAWLAHQESLRLQIVQGEC